MRVALASPDFFRGCYACRYKKRFEAFRKFAYAYVKSYFLLEIWILRISSSFDE